MQRKRKRKKAVVVGEEASGSGKKVAAGVDIQSGVAFTVARNGFTRGSRVDIVAQPNCKCYWRSVIACERIDMASHFGS